jgi:hypothetical protein
MKAARAIPFQNLKAQGWLNLALAGSVAFYAIQIGLELLWGNTCGHLAIDYCAFWSAGKIANTRVYADAYDLHVLEGVERTIFPGSADPAAFALSPIAYLPIFILPFQVLALLPPVPGFGIWSSLNLIGLICYLRFFAAKTGAGPLPRRTLAMLLISLPVFLNLFTGQVNVWLAVCVGEFMRASSSGREFRAGLWLGGLLLKPQALLLLAAGLLIRRRARIVAGLALAATLLAGLSFGMAGAEGMKRLAGIWLGFAGGLPTNDVEIMMNWRMLGLHIGAASTPAAGSWLAIAGMAVTLAGTLYLWRASIEWSAETLAVLLVGTLAGTALFAWHSHAHMALFLLPPLIYLQMQKRLPGKLLAWWVLPPVAIYAGAFALAALIQAKLLPAGISGFPDFARGASEFGLNVYLLVWAIRTAVNGVQPLPASAG